MNQRRTLKMFMLLCLLAVTQAFAQLTVQLIMNPNPSPYLADWEQRAETAMLQITNPGDPMEVKISARILLDGSRVAATNMTRMQTVQVPSGATTWDASRIFPLSNIDFFGDAKQTALRTGKLRAGRYQFCADLVDPVSGNILTKPACAFFGLSSFQPPVCLQPANGSGITNLPGQVFRWTPVTPAPTEPVHYIVSVFEVLEGQSATQAFRSNKPIISEEVTGSTQLVWSQQIISMDPGLPFVWSVQALDGQGKPIGGSDGWAEPFTFNFKGAGSDLQQTGYRNYCMIGRDGTLEFMDKERNTVGTAKCDRALSVMLLPMDNHHKAQIISGVIRLHDISFRGRTLKDIYITGVTSDEFIIGSDGRYTMTMNVDFLGKRLTYSPSGQIYFTATAGGVVPSGFKGNPKQVNLIGLAEVLESAGQLAKTPDPAGGADQGGNIKNKAGDLLDKAGDIAGQAGNVIGIVGDTIAILGKVFELLNIDCDEYVYIGSGIYIKQDSIPKGIKACVYKCDDGTYCILFVKESDPCPADVTFNKQMCKYYTDIRSKRK